MSKRVAFVGLVVLTVIFAAMGRRLQADFFSDLWSQLFWLTLGTLATTFLLDAILERAANARQRSSDAFAFRSFAASMLNALHEIVGLQPMPGKLLEAALLGDKQFEAASAHVASLIEQSSSFDPSAYLRHYLDVSSGLRDMSRNYIRLFSTNRKEMLEQYQGLNELANRWDYKEDFSEGSRKYTASLPATDPDRSAREASLQGQLASARSLAANTARQVAHLAAKTATGTGFYE